MPYSEAFKRRMVEKMCGPDAVSACALAKQEGVSQTTLSRWKRQAAMLGDMSKRHKHEKFSEKPTSRRPQDWSLEEKLQAIIEASGLSGSELGAYLRRKGLHEGTLGQWRALLESALSDRPTRPKKSREHRDADKRVRALERELKRKNAALAEAAALLVLKKKVREIWGDEGDDIAGKSG